MSDSLNFLSYRKEPFEKDCIPYGGITRIRFKGFFSAPPEYNNEKSRRRTPSPTDSVKLNQAVDFGKGNKSIFATGNAGCP